jgi:DNA-binding response OmpR family regulator
MTRSILVVDDETQIRDLLQIYLRRQGFSVTTASSSEETLKQLAEKPSELVVLDISLGEEDGLGLLDRIKASYPAVKVIMLTGMGFVEDLLQEAHQKGADGYVSKVLPLDELLLTIQRILRGAEARAASC